MRWAGTLVVAVLLILQARAAQPHNRPYSIVRPLPDHTKLEVDPDGLEVLRAIPGPISPVVVIGPYRSGKSFLLNQLMGVSCDEGFGVGHSRKTETKGVWFWGEPIQQHTGPDGPLVNVLYVDTEGFESTGKADVYDDRIFALSTIISAVLVYNLPETIRESDLERLSFAVELAKAFYGERDGAEEAGAGGLEPSAMLWLVQRDFLQGDSLAATLAAALEPVPNPHHDKGMDQLNRIRESLHVLARSSSALGLPQPHLNRTALCTLGDEALAPGYVGARAAARARVAELAGPKLVRGATLSGADLARLIEDSVAALNAREIPTAGSLVEYFNRELVQACKQQFVAMLASLVLPVAEEALRSEVRAAEEAALSKFQRERFGSGTEALAASLREELGREAAARADANEAASQRTCDAEEAACEDELDRAGRQRLPAMQRFLRQYGQCRTRFEAACVGPARAAHSERLAKTWERERARFLADYNDRLLNGLTMLSIAAILAFRFVIKLQLGETIGWAAFLFLQVYPKMFLMSGSMFEQKWWLWLVASWEAVASNPLTDLGRGGWALVLLAVAAAALRSWWRPRLERGLARWRRTKRRISFPDSGTERDLDV